MLARRTWSQIESIHAVTYFSSESVDGAKDAGLRGFWMGYFGFRACPLGPVEPGVVDAAFANFAPLMVRRSIPDAWQFADPADLVVARARAAGGALRRVSPSVERVALDVNPVLEEVIATATSIGRPMFCANRDLARFDDPVERLWQNCTTLREHRGDGHVAALVAAGVDGPEAHLLIAAEHGVAPAVFFDNRGWSAEEQHDARERLVERGLLDESGLTSDGAALRTQVETITDVRAAAPYADVLSNERWADTIDRLAQVAADVVASDTIPFPNPMGLPSPETPAG
ncbi:MAG: hypothetical protein WA964_17990 [Ilumatobacter sp.]|uniref:SCO6745 family protein n=1 Tax=Ilumatobacter sp. TaxID=1967498 RepID=UPI003C727C73